MPRVAKLNERAVKQADEVFYKKHPELKGRPLTSSKLDAHLRAEWLELYGRFGGKVIGRLKPGSRKTTLAKCVTSGKVIEEVYVYIVEMAGGDPYGHVGLVLQQKNGSYIRYSQAARNPNLQGWNKWEYVTWWQEVDVRQRIFPKGTSVKTLASGGKIIRIPTEHPDQIQNAVNKYISDKSNYHVITNNCADFVNDVLNSADDVSVWDATIPKDYFEKLERQYPDCVIK